MVDDRDPVGWRQDVQGRCTYVCCADVSAPLVSGAIGRSLIDAQAAYRASLVGLLDLEEKQ